MQYNNVINVPLPPLFILPLTIVMHFIPASYQYDSNDADLICTWKKAWAHTILSEDDSGDEMQHREKWAWCYVNEVCAPGYTMT